jgi:hypothetical protein
MRKNFYFGILVFICSFSLISFFLLIVGYGERETLTINESINLKEFINMLPNILFYTLIGSILTVGFKLKFDKEKQNEVKRLEELRKKIEAEEKKDTTMVQIKDKAL